MSRIIFQVSRYVVRNHLETGVVTKEQLRLKERYNSQREQVTAMATLHMQGDEPWLSGMHYCYIDNQGERYYSFNKTEGVEFKVDFKINLIQKQLAKLRKQLEAAGDKVSSPAKDEDGVSQLRGIQLHVILTDDAELGLNSKTDDKWGDRLQQKVNAHFIKEVKLVVASDADYIQSPDTQTMAADVAIQAIYQVTKKEEVKKPETAEEAKAAVFSLMRARSRGEQRQPARGAKAIKPTTSSISLEEDDEEQPE